MSVSGYIFMRKACKIFFVFLNRVHFMKIRETHFSKSDPKKNLREFLKPANP